MTNKKLISVSLAFGFSAAVLLSMCGFKSSCDEMYHSLIRIRILANSDSKEDQELKLAVRDAVLASSKEVLGEAESYDEAVLIAKSSLNEIKATALECVRENGFDYDVSVAFKNEFFDTRVYDDFTLSAGNYKTAVIYIGNGEGKNWWCVMFPQVCVGACSGRLEDTLSKESANIAYEPDKYVIKFKTVEIFENIKKVLDF